ncbi:dynein light chain Tctex-type 1-like [Platichthys flesus]|uniref:dynein light chain Tctex-type 1-like n=1 Tax=Platichthys flesus TaxID=8260 RepID=UPI002DBDF73B|nr:dynein light chain Tctex-type 1-like [Platichthys flesus]
MSGLPLKFQAGICHRFSAFWLRSSVVSVLISLISDTSPTRGPYIKLIFGTGRWNRGLLRPLHASTWYCSTSRNGAPPSRCKQQIPKIAFVDEEVSKVIKESVEAAIGGNTFQHSRVNQWTTSVLEHCLNQLKKLGKPFKYIVTCIIMQKNGAGLQIASTCFWDNSTDGSCLVRWENKSMYCIVSVFGLTP